MRNFFVLPALILAILTSAGGCIERILTVQTDPPGALVELNGQEMKGRTPVTQDFTWYGTYDIILRLENYQTLKTTAKVFPPIYEWIPLDLVTDLLPFLIRDHHVVSYTLTPQPPASQPSPGIIERAIQLRAQMDTTHYPNEKPAK
jgi:hypothetical protein